MPKRCHWKLILLSPITFDIKIIYWTISSRGKVLNMSVLREKCKSASFLDNIKNPQVSQVFYHSEAQLLKQLVNEYM